MSNEILILFMFVGLLVILVGLQAHLGFALCAVAIIAGLIGKGSFAFLEMFPMGIWGIMGNYVLVAIPLFVFMGFMLERAGFGEDLFGGAELIFGKLRGGMALMVILITTVLAACTGVVATGVVMAGVLALPSMLRRRYNKPLALGTVAAGGTLGVLIPPSILIVFYASQTNMSVGKLFLAAFLPGFTLCGLYLAYVIIITAIFPEWAPKRGEVEEDTAYGVPFSIESAKHPRLRAFLSLIPIVFLLMAVLGSIIFGIAAPTEAAAAGALGAIIIAAAYRKLSFKNLLESSLNTIGTMGMIGVVIIGAMSFTAVFSALDGRQIITKYIALLGLSPISTLILILAVEFLLGMFLDPIAILLILIPVAIPISVDMGWDPLWFGMLLCVTMQSAWLSPPFGYALFFLRGLNLPKVTFTDISKGALQFIVLQVIGVGLCIAFPQIILWLPNLLID